MTPAESARPGISVIVITLNEERRIGTCLDSLVASDYPAGSFEIIVVDASSDETARIASGYSGVRVLRAEKGFARQKNAGLMAAEHGIVAFTDADCTVPPGWLAAIAEALERPDVVGAGGNAFPPEGTGFFGRCVAAVGHPAGGSIGFDANVTPGRPEGIEFIAGCNGAFRRASVLAIGGFDETFDPGGEDVDLSWRLRAAGGRLAYAPRMDVYHEPHVPFGAYVTWNVRVGVSKYLLRRPGILRLLVDPRFALWTVLALGALVTLGFRSPAALAPAVLMSWALLVAGIYALARPYRLLMRRRAQARLPLWAILTIVPMLIWTRQLAINAGEIATWRRFSR